ncbi:MAG: hypothetical protein FD126_3570, partial [Elusimicrobia bacterium]
MFFWSSAALAFSSRICRRSFSTIVEACWTLRLYSGFAAFNWSMMRWAMICGVSAFLTPMPMRPAEGRAEDGAGRDQHGRADANLGHQRPILLGTSRGAREGGGFGGRRGLRQLDAVIRGEAAAREEGLQGDATLGGGGAGLSDGLGGLRQALRGLRDGQDAGHHGFHGDRARGLGRHGGD